MVFNYTSWNLFQIHDRIPSFLNCLHKTTGDSLNTLAICKIRTKRGCRAGAYVNLKRGLKENQWGYLKLGESHKLVWRRLHPFYPAVPKIFHVKHDVGASTDIIFIDNPDIDSLSIVNDANPVLT